MLSSLGRALDTLELLAREQRPLGLGEIARLLSMSKSSAHEVLTTEQVMTREPAMKLGLSVIQRSDEFGPVVMPGLTVRLSASAT